MTKEEFQSQVEAEAKKYVRESIEEAIRLQGEELRPLTEHWLTVATHAYKAGYYACYMQTLNQELEAMKLAEADVPGPYVSADCSNGHCIACTNVTKTCACPCHR